jgi:hypothetical protein
MFFLFPKFQVPEATLQASALLGGWAGGLWAMEKFRHKTKKQPFRTMCVFERAWSLPFVAQGTESIAQLLFCCWTERRWTCWWFLLPEQKRQR